MRRNLIRFSCSSCDGLIAIKPYQSLRARVYDCEARQKASISNRIIYRLGFTIRFSFNENQRYFRIQTHTNTHTQTIFWLTLRINCDHIAYRQFEMPMAASFSSYFFLSPCVLSVFWCLAVIKRYTTILLTSESKCHTQSTAVFSVYWFPVKLTSFTVEATHNIDWHRFQLCFPPVFSSYIYDYARQYTA